jgi:hypothetical protein
MKPITILLSGPPRSGKDTLAREIYHVASEEGLRVATSSVGQLLKTATHQLFACLQGCSVILSAGSETFKDEPSDFFAGLTPREAYIGVHEDYIKPNLGETFLAKQLADLIERSHEQVVVVTDVGNTAEAMEMPPGVVVHVHRDGVTWSDNRSPVDRLGRHMHLDYQSVQDVREIRRWVKMNLLPAIMNAG